MRWNGSGKLMWSGNIYIGGYKDGKRAEGKLYKLQKNHNHTLFHVKHDDKGHEIEKKEIRKGHKIV